MDVYLGLVHHPVKNKRGNIVTTSVTNLDIHDIARSCRTFGVKKYFLITPINLQHELIRRVTGHWETDKANEYNPDRKDAFTVVSACYSIEEAMEQIKKIEEKDPLIVVTGANFKSFDGDTELLMKKLAIDNRPMLLLFGTGWGLSASVVERADFRLLPIYGYASDGYNHLSVRSAVAIYLDRLHRGL